MSNLIKQNVGLTEFSNISADDCKKFLDFYGQKDQLSDLEREQFLKIAMLNNLNPFNREIHISSYGKGEYRQFAIIIGYEVYIRRAERTGLLEHWKTEIKPCKTAVTDNRGVISFIDDIEAIITIKRKDFINPFEHSVKFSEYVQKTKDGNVTKFWTKVESQLKKVAISQGFRLCFSEELKHLPYSNIESEQTGYTEIIEVKTAPENVKINSQIKEQQKELIPPTEENLKDILKYLKESKDESELDKRMKLVKKKYLISHELESNILLDVETATS